MENRGLKLSLVKLKGHKMVRFQGGSYPNCEQNKTELLSGWLMCKTTSLKRDYPGFFTKLKKWNMLNRIFQYENTVFEEYCVRGSLNLYSSGLWVEGKEGEKCSVITPEALFCTFPQCHPKPSLPTTLMKNLWTFSNWLTLYGRGMLRPLPEISVPPVPFQHHHSQGRFWAFSVIFWVWRITSFKRSLMAQSYCVLGGLPQITQSCFSEYMLGPRAKLLFILTPAGLKWIIVHWLHGL